MGVHHYDSNGIGTGSYLQKPKQPNPNLGEAHLLNTVNNNDRQQHQQHLLLIMANSESIIIINYQIITISSPTRSREETIT